MITVLRRARLHLPGGTGADTGPRAGGAGPDDPELGGWVPGATTTVAPLRPGPGPDSGGRPDRAASPVVAVADLHISFARGGRQVRAVRGVTLEVGRGEILGLVGESGSGKSVLGLALLGLLPVNPAPTVSGSAVVCGTDMTTATAEQARLVRRRHLGAVFQDPMTSLNPTMRVGRQVAEACGDGASAVELLDSVGVPDPRRRALAYPHELSGGLRQRVMIAMAVGGSPSLVVADEPTTALDVTVQAQILQLLRHLCNTMGTSFILVTHDLGVAAQVSDRIAVLYAGRLAEVGPAADLFTDAHHPYTKGLLRSRLVLDSDRTRPVATLPGEPPDPRALPPGCPFAPRCQRRTGECEADLPALTAVGSPSGGSPSDVGGPGGRAVACLHPVTAGAAGAGGAELTDGTEAGDEPWADPPRPAHRGRVPAVLVHGVHKSFSVGSGLRRQRLHALRGVDLELMKGESVALVGESGCGKSTLLRVIAGLQTADLGSVEFARGGSRPQMVFQDAGASLTPWMLIGELVGERLLEEGMNRRQRAARVGDALRLVGLPAEVAEAKAAQLSGGQRQRVALARATVVPPDLLLCDEPTSALDVSLAATVLNLIGRLRRELGMAVLFVTHDLAAARIVADRIAVMYLGRIVELGPAEALCAAPVHPYTQALLGAVPDAGRHHVPIVGEPANPLDPPAGCAFRTRCPQSVDACAVTDQVLLAPAAADHPAPSGGRLVACSVAAAPAMAPPMAFGSAAAGSGAGTPSAAGDGRSGGPLGDR